MNKYFIDFYYENMYNAGSKARDDISYFLKEMNFNPIMLKKKKSKLMNLLNIYNIAKKINTISPNSEVLIQYPFNDTKVYNNLIINLLKIKKCRCILLLHDIGSLRFRLSSNEIKKEIDYINKFNIVIAHNKKMEQWLEKNRIKRKIINLELFDYKVDSYFEKQTYLENSIVFAGNLSENKSGFIYRFKKENVKDFKINLYGVGIEENRLLQNMNYLGKYDASDLPNKLKGKYGLLWDGPSVEECIGDFGEYLKYNNPHKFSLYLASDLPVIVWEKAAIADFVIKNNIGITINSLENISSILNDIGDEEYSIMRLNASKIGKKVRSGEYVKNALDKI